MKNVGYTAEMRAGLEANLAAVESVTSSEPFWLPLLRSTPRPTRRQRWKRRIQNYQQRLGHAWDALVHDDCDWSN